MIESWILIAFIAPFLWALVAVIDTYFVHGVYSDEYDGTVVSGLFQVFPWILVLMGVIQFTFPGNEIAFLALFAGGFFITSFFCYFWALFVSNDTALMQTIWSLSIPAVPFFSWIILGEILLPMHYVGIGIALFGVLLFHFDAKVRKIGFLKIVLPMSAAVVFLSLSMVIGKKAYEFSDQPDFWSIYLLFSTGAVITSFLILLIGRGRQSLVKLRHIGSISKRYLVPFFLSEGLSLIATIASQKAISLAPSVSYVVVIESLVPVFIMLISLAIFSITMNIGKFNSDIYKEQFRGASMKILATIFIAIGIYIVV